METRRRYFIEIAYKGTRYHGWQIQPNAVTVQQVLGNALQTVFRQPVETTGCGRTDTGVHASQFFAHFDVTGKIKIDSASTLARLNALCGTDIAVKRVIPVHPDAHARFDATRRSYQYRIHLSKDPFKTDLSWLVKNMPDITLMNQAAGSLKNFTDFSSFSKSNTQVFTNNCKISDAAWTQTNEGVVFDISADRFLRNMVRAIVGTLLDIGYGKNSLAAIGEIIASRDRSSAGTSVPACGLHLTSVCYPYIDDQLNKSHG